jgi:catechol 2,3-dioxygenase-like lactoylglutathione lyase family enzyme
VPTIAGIHHTKVPVSDLERSLRWYEQVFDARHQPELDHATNGDVWASVLHVPGLAFPLMLIVTPKKAAAMSGFDPANYSIESRAELQEWIQHLDVVGIEHSSELRGYIGWLLVFRDPDGLAIRLYTKERHPFGEENADVDSPWVAYR